MGLFGGSSSKTEIVSLLSPAAKSTNKNVGELLDEFLRTGNLPFGFNPVGPSNDLIDRAFGRASDQFDAFDQFAASNRTALGKQVQGIPAFKFDEGRTTSRFKDQFAIPLMEVFRESIAPLISESFAGIPGSFRSRDRGTAIGFGAEDFARRNINPVLFEAFQRDEERAFQSGEAAAARVPGAVDQLTRLAGIEFGTFAGISEAQRQAGQIPVDIFREEYARLLSMALGFATTPTSTVVTEQGSKGSLGTIAGIGAGIAANVLVPGAGIGGLSTFEVLALGGVVGSGLN